MKRRSGRPSIRGLDVVVVAFAVTVTAFATVFAYAGDGSGYVSVQNGTDEWIYSLDTDRSIDVSGPLGPTHIEIQNGAARVTDSPCRDKICVAMGAIDSAGEWVACLPNGVFMRVVGERNDGVDAIVY